jgi:hypothetical protein
MATLYLVLSLPEVHHAPAGVHRGAAIVLEGALSAATKYGANTLLLGDEGFTVEALHVRCAGGGWERRAAGGLVYSAAFHRREQREAARAARARLATLVPAGVPLDDLFPFLAVISSAGGAGVYHHALAGKRGLAYLRFHASPLPVSAGDPGALLSLIESARAPWELARRSINHACWYSKQDPEVEVEVKFTLAEPVDTWSLNLKLHRAILAGELAGFVPELNDEFQVWDFENHMLEVLGPGDERGCVTIIPQSDGRLTLKHKIFDADQEARVERMYRNLAADGADLAAFAARYLGATLRPLPPYRRKRFDVNLESLATGNVYGIFFDLCRLLDDPSAVLVQCEVEYLRTRRLGPIEGVRQELEAVCAFTERFLMENGVAFSRGYYSKLSFLRDYVARRSGVEVG